MTGRFCPVTFCSSIYDSLHSEPQAVIFITRAVIVQLLRVFTISVLTNGEDFINNYA